jgi:hypothetical protein
MASKADFTEDEWKAMQKGVMGAGLLASLSDPDFTDTFGEAGALAKYLGEQREKSASQLVRDLSSTKGGGFGLTASKDKVEGETLSSLRSATATLASKAPDELGAYRELALGVADRVANAKGGLTPQETAAVDKIKEALAPG